MKKVDFILQAKGGVGKSFVSFLLAQYIKDKKSNLIAVDTDTTNPTLLAYKALNTTHIELCEGNKIISRKFDDLMELIFSSPEESHIVVDVGSNGFQSLMQYAIENEAFAMLQEEKIGVTINLIIAGGSDLEETLKGAVAISNHTETAYRCWINEYQHPAIIEQSGKHVTEISAFKNIKKKGVINLPYNNPDTLAIDLDEMLKKRITFDEYYEQAHLMPKKRLQNYRKNIYEQLDKSEV